MKAIPEYRCPFDKNCSALNPFLESMEKFNRKKTHSMMDVLNYGAAVRGHEFLLNNFCNGPYQDCPAYKEQSGKETKGTVETSEGGVRSLELHKREPEVNTSEVEARTVFIISRGN